MNLLDIEAFRAIHAKAIGLFGGASALMRDENLFQSSMARAGNLIAYGQPSISDVAATYIFGIIDNHPFIAGKHAGCFILDDHDAQAVATIGQGHAQFGCLFFGACGQFFEEFAPLVNPGLQPQGTNLRHCCLSFNTSSNHTAVAVICCVSNL